MNSEVVKALNLLYRGNAKSLDEKQSAYVKIVLALEEGERAKKELEKNEVEENE